MATTVVVDNCVISGPHTPLTILQQQILDPETQFNGASLFVMINQLFNITNTEVSNYNLATSGALLYATRSSIVYASNVTATCKLN